jgi:hypothetical protein
MRIRVFLVFIVLSLTFAPAQGKINGYFSLSYIKGQNQTDFHQGSFQNPIFGLIFSGDVTEKINYTAELRFEEDSFELEQLFVGFKPSDAFNLKLGLYLVPFGRYNQFNRAYQTALVNSPLNVETTFPLSWRDIGVLIEGKLGSFFYSAYLGNGLAEGENLSQSQQFKDNNADKGKGGRVGMALSEHMAVAYSIYKGKYVERNMRDLVLQGLDLTWSEESFEVLAEYSRANLENPENFNEGRNEGYFIQVSLNAEKLQPVLCCQWMRYKDPFHGPGFVGPDLQGEGISEKKGRWALGLRYLISEAGSLKLEYDFNREKGVNLKDDIFSIQVALSF